MVDEEWAIQFRTLLYENNLLERLIVNFELVYNILAFP